MSLSILIVASFALVVHSCSMPPGWRQKSVGERAKQAEIVLYGKVINSPVKWEFQGNLPKLVKKEGFYEVRVEVYCILKGADVAR